MAYFSVAADNVDNRGLFQVTAFKTEYMQWKEYLPSQQQNPLVSEDGMIYHLLSNWNYHNRKRLSFDLSIDAFWGNTGHLSHEYNAYYDTFLTVSGTTQCVGMNIDAGLGYDFVKIFLQRIKASLTPQIGVKYAVWKRSAPWVFVYLTDTRYVTYWGYDEYWNNLLAVGGVRLGLKFTKKISLSMDIAGAVPGYVLERSDVSNAAKGNYKFDLKPKLEYRIDGKATINISGFFFGLSACRMVYNPSDPVHVTNPKDEYRFQPQSIVNYGGIIIGYVLPIRR